MEQQRQMFCRFLSGAQEKRYRKKVFFEILFLQNMGSSLVLSLPLHLFVKVGKKCQYVTGRYLRRVGLAN